MQTILNPRQIAKAAYDTAEEASRKMRQILKDIGYEHRGDGTGMTGIGKMYRYVKRKSSGAFAFLAGSNSLITQLALADAFSNNASIGNVWNTLKNWGANFSTPVNVEVTQSPTEIAQEFAMEAACENVIAELKAQELAFEADLEAEVQSVFHKAGEFIGPLQELEHVHANLEHQHRLRQLFNPDGMCTYAHCADKVADLKAAFAPASTEAAAVPSPSARVMVYNSAANADSAAPIHEPNRHRGLGIEAPHLQPTSCPA